MRDRKSEPAEIDIAKLPALTDQQMTFALGVIDGKTATEAYLEGYPTSQGWPRASVWAKASHMLRNDKVMAWINAWRSLAMVSGVTTLEEHTSQLMRIRELALASGNYGAAAKCEESRGRANGLYVDRIKTEDGSETSLIKALAELAKSDGSTARAIATSLGLKLPDSDASQAHNLEQPQEHVQAVDSTKLLN